MHMSGLLGQPRRTAVLPGELGGTVELYNLLSSLGYVVLFGSALVFLYNLIRASRAASRPARPVGRPHARVAHRLAAEARQLRHDPDRHPPRRVLAPQVRRGRGGQGRPGPAGASEDHDADGEHDEHIHMPDPSYWPLVMTSGSSRSGTGWSSPTRG
jgi:cytochrome c oxidase subunit I